MDAQRVVLPHGRATRDGTVFIIKFCACIDGRLRWSLVDLFIVAVCADGRSTSGPWHERRALRDGTVCFIKFASASTDAFGGPWCIWLGLLGATSSGHGLSNPTSIRAR